MLIVISGPSGVGKGTLINYILSQHPRMALSTSATTRPPRDGEMHGTHYYFFSDAAFDDRIASNAFLEWCHVHTARYGTLKDDVISKQAEAPAVIIEIDVQGAQKIRQHHDIPQHHIFVAPPSMDVLAHRLKTRNTEDPQTIQKRLKEAQKELDQKKPYDTIIVNNELTQCCHELNNVILGILTKGVTQ
jgi:guanylate kinase